MAIQPPHSQFSSFVCVFNELKHIGRYKERPQLMLQKFLGEVMSVLSWASSVVNFPSCTWQLEILSLSFCMFNELNNSKALFCAKQLPQLLLWRICQSYLNMIPIRAFALYARCEHVGNLCKVQWKRNYWLIRATGQIESDKDQIVLIELNLQRNCGLAKSNIANLSLRKWKISLFDPRLQSCLLAVNC